MNRTNHRTISINSTVSKIPRWCGNKPPVNCSQPNAISEYGSPTTFAKSELNGICEPPGLQERELKKVWKVKAQRHEVDANLRDAIAHVEHLKERLRDVKCKVEELSVRLTSPAAQPNIEQCQNPKTAVSLAKENMRLRRELMDNLCLEEELTQNLEKAHRKLWEAGVADQFLSVEIEDKINPIINQFHYRKAFQTQKRALREKSIKENAIKLRQQALTSVVNSLRKSADEPSRKVQISMKVNAVRKAKSQLYPFMRKTMLARRKAKLLQSSYEQMRQERQYKNLNNLKSEIDAQKDSLIATSISKKKKASRMAKEKEKVRNELAASGKNPYYVDHILALEERRAAQQRTILEVEQERLMNLHRDYENVERAKRLEEYQKKKWDAFWAKKLKEKKMAVAKTQYKFFNRKSRSFQDDSMALDKDYESDGSTMDNFDRAETHETHDHNNDPCDSSSVQKRSKASKSSRDDYEAEHEHSLGTSVNKHSSADNPLEPVVSNTILGTDLSDNKKRSRDAKHQQGSANTEMHESQEVRRKYHWDKSNVRNMSESDKVDILDFKTEEIAGEFDEEEGLNYKKLLERDHHRCSHLHARSMGDAPQPRFKYKSKASIKTRSVGFHWLPAIVKFADYEVGKTYKQILTVTNISTDRVKLALKDFENTPKAQLESSSRKSPSQSLLPIPIANVVKVKFNRSKILSPGLHHDIHLTFSPPVKDDWNGVLKFQSSFESFQVIVQCLQQQFLPKLSPEKAVFNNVVPNTCASFKIQLKNLGAKPGVISHIIQKTHAALRRDDIFNLALDFHTNEVGKHESVAEHFDTGETPVSFGNDHDDIAHHDDPNDTHNDNEHDENITESTDLDSTVVPRIGKKKRGRRTTLNPAESSSRRPSASHTPRPRPSIKINKLDTDAPVLSLPEQNTENGSDFVKGILDEVLETVMNKPYLAYVKECRRDLEKGDVRTLNVIFRPPYEDTFETTFEIHFEDPDEKMITFTAVGTTMETPISVTPINTNFKICMIDHNYQQLVTVSSAIRGAGKVTAEVPKELRQVIEVVPKTATVFGKSPGKFSVKFRPNLKMMEKDSPESKFIDMEANIIDFPVYFHLKFPFKVSTPLITTFMAVFTNQSLEFFPPELDMGKCSASETLQAVVTIYNNCRLPQRIGFKDIPECITVQPNYGFATLLPFEKRPFDILLSLPVSALGEQIFKLKCITIEKRDFEFVVKVFAEIK